MAQLSELSAENFMRALIGRSDVDDALTRLDKLTNEETWMAIVELVGVTHTIHQAIGSSFANLATSDGGVSHVLAGDQ